MTFIAALAWTEAVSQALTLGAWPDSFARTAVFLTMSYGPLLLFRPRPVVVTDDAYSSDDEGEYA